MAAFGDPISTALSIGQALARPTQFGPVTGPGFLDPWGVAYQAGLAPIPSPIQVATGFGNAIGLPTIGLPGAPGLPFITPSGPGGLLPAGAAAGATAGVAAAGGLAAILGPAAGMGVGALILLVVVGAIILAPLFKSLVAGVTTSGTSTCFAPGTLLLLLLLGGLLIAGMGGGGGMTGGQDWTFVIILFLVAIAALGLFPNLLGT